MAYYLQFDGSNDRVTIQCQATSSESWSLEWQLFAIPTPDSFGFARIFGGATAAESTNRISSQIGGGDISTRFAGTNKIWSGKTFTNTDEFRIEYNGSQLELFINDVPSGVIAGTVTVNFGLLGCNSNFYTNMALMYATFTNITTPSKSRDYQPSLSNGAGTALLDAANAINGTLVNFPTDNSQWVFYESGGPPAGTTYDAGGVSAMLMSSVGGASVTASAGGASTVTLSESGGASLTAAAGGASAMVMTAQGAAEVGSEITAGGVSAMTMTATGGATVTARAGGVSQFTFSVSGGVALSAGVGGTSHATMPATGGASLVAAAGGISAMTMTAAGGGVVNEQVVTVNRVALPAAQLLTTMVLPPVAMLQSVSIQGQYNYRRTL